MKNSTEHKVKKAAKSFECSVQHSSSRAYQFDFFVPKAIWKLRVVTNFFDALSALGGATIFDGEIGIWKGEKETTQVFRLIVRGDVAAVRKKVRREIGKLMATLCKTKHAQEAMLYTETRIRRYMAGRLKRVH